MPSFSIHLAVGKRYLEKNLEIKDKNGFYLGILAPDFATDKQISHYTGERNRNDIIDFLEKKVQLSSFLEKENIDTDYQKGVFIHLITDYVFFTSFFSKDYLSSNNLDTFLNNLYYSYDQVNDYLNEKYLIDYSIFSVETRDKIDRNIKRKLEQTRNGTNILSFDKLDVLIEEVSNVNLDSIRYNIQNNISLVKKYLT